MSTTFTIRFFLVRQSKWSFDTTLPVWCFLVKGFFSLIFQTYLIYIWRLVIVDDLYPIISIGTKFIILRELYLYVNNQIIHRISFRDCIVSIYVKKLWINCISRQKKRNKNLWFIFGRKRDLLFCRKMKNPWTWINLKNNNNNLLYQRTI